MMPTWAQTAGVSPKEDSGAFWVYGSRVPLLYTPYTHHISTLKHPEIPTRAHNGSWGVAKWFSPKNQWVRPCSWAKLGQTQRFCSCNSPSGGTPAIHSPDVLPNGKNAHPKHARDGLIQPSARDPPSVPSLPLVPRKWGLHGWSGFPVR